MSRKRFNVVDIIEAGRQALVGVINARKVKAVQGRPSMSTLKVLPDFEDAMAAIKDYARDWPGGDYRADFEAAATEAGWTDLQKTDFVIALVEAMCDLREKPH